MPGPLRVYISHARDIDRQSANDVAAAIGAFGVSNVFTHTSQQFAPGSDWMTQVEQKLGETDWLLFLFKGDNRDYRMSFLEIGSFARLDRPTNRLVCLYPPSLKPPSELRMEKIPAAETEVKELLWDVYVRAPWMIDERYQEPANESLRKDHADKLIRAVVGSPDSETKRYTCSMRIDILPSSIEAWHETGVIPDDALVTGEGPWEHALGKGVNSGSWMWKHLVGDLPRRNAWVPILADALRSAEHGEPATREIYVPRPSAEGVTYRLLIYKCEKIKATKELQFHLIIAPVPPKFDPGATDPFSIVHHLVSVAWHFRWRIINKHSAEVRDLQQMRRRPKRVEEGFDQRIRRLTAEFQADMLAVAIDAQIRGLTDADRVLDAFRQPPQGEPLTKESQEDVDTLAPLLLDEWPNVQVELEKAMERGEDGLEDAQALMKRVNGINRIFYDRSTRRYWELTKSSLR